MLAIKMMGSALITSLPVTILLDDSKGLRVTAFDVLQQFGGSKRGSSDHCPLWCRLERGDKEKHVAIVEEMRTNEDFLDADILQRIERLGKPPAPPEFEDMLMSEAFENEESDDESNSDCDDVCRLERRR